MAYTADRRRLIPRRMIPWIAAAVAILVAVGISVLVATGTLGRLARDRVVKVLKQHYGAGLQFKNLTVRLFPQVRVEATDLTFRQPGRPDTPPLITIQKLSAVTSPMEALRAPPRVREVRLEGLRIQVSRRGESGPHPKKQGGKKPPDFVIDSVLADGTQLTVIPRKEGKPPLEFDIRRLRLTGAGPSQPMSFRATLRNAKPPGDIQTVGQFGPWEKDAPGDTPVTGRYTFRDADLSVFRGISGKLASDGNYRGTLDHIEVDGQTDVPDFTVKVSGNPVHLTTKFHAIVDGTDGDTYLQPVDAQVGESRILAKGSIEGVKGVKGKTVSLDVDTNGRLQDILRLGTKGQPPMSGAIRFHTKLVIPPGDVDIAEKLHLDGAFRIDDARFTKLDIQQKINDLSHRGKGRPEELKTDMVASDFTGRFALNQGQIRFQRLSFCVPGVGVALAGRYGILDEAMDFHGKATLEAKVSETTTGWKSVLLKAVDPFFHKKDAGAVIPFHVGGTRDHPTFGLDLHK